MFVAEVLGEDRLVGMLATSERQSLLEARGGMSKVEDGREF